MRKSNVSTLRLLRAGCQSLGFFWLCTASLVSHANANDSDSTSCGFSRFDSGDFCPEGCYAQWVPGITDGVDCTVTSPGYFSLDGHYERKACEVGYYQDSHRASSCLPCPPGSFSREVASAECTPCPSGHYQLDVGQTTCFPCMTTIFDGLGSDSVITDPDGEFLCTKRPTPWPSSSPSYSISPSFSPSMMPSMSLPPTHDPTTTLPTAISTTAPTNDNGAASQTLLPSTTDIPWTTESPTLSPSAQDNGPGRGRGGLNRNQKIAAGTCAAIFVAVVFFMPLLSKIRPNRDEDSTSSELEAETSKEAVGDKVPDRLELAERGHVEQIPAVMVGVEGDNNHQQHRHYYAHRHRIGEAPAFLSPVIPVHRDNNQVPFPPAENVAAATVTPYPDGEEDDEETKVPDDSFETISTYAYTDPYVTNGFPTNGSPEAIRDLTYNETLHESQDVGESFTAVMQDGDEQYLDQGDYNDGDEQYLDQEYDDTGFYQEDDLEEPTSWEEQQGIALYSNEENCYRQEDQNQEAYEQAGYFGWQVDGYEADNSRMSAPGNDEEGAEFDYSFSPMSGSSHPY
ncbi:expressed unknown protein [Seminavis robusta]|uniref:Tyrosine-protein kinase ephrin type A/B receptor-like domain-containing protein n=1 Tax=Seminavis robusta TaxID=568900 RepID=A0A9N8DC32_9STRA|nr:expressed unknown protein [Seminavis robusta]|eukprot:Sro25_g016930.1 n/a (569) ;mRNA; f:70898-72604